MNKCTLLRQIIHDVINTLSCLLFEIDNPLAMECVYQLRLFQHFDKINNEEKLLIEFQEDYKEEIKYFQKEYKISINFIGTIDTMKEILIFLLLNKKSCSLIVGDNEINCYDYDNFNQEIFNGNNGILNHISFHKNFVVRKNEIGFSIIKNS